MNDFPTYIGVTFALTTCLTIALFYLAAHRSQMFVVIIAIWIMLQTALALKMFYTVTDTVPPRVLLLAMPPVLLIAILFLTTKGKTFIDSLDIKYLTILHIIRIPVELVLLWLSINKAVPELMTFEGRNFDIISGITAPVVFYFGLVKKKWSKKILLAWNFICLALLLNIVINAVLAAPTNFQQLAFDQPNIAILYYPFNLLPAVIVPLVLLSHLVAIRQLWRK